MNKKNKISILFGLIGLSFSLINSGEAAPKRRLFFFNSIAQVEEKYRINQPAYSPENAVIIESQEQLDELNPETFIIVPNCDPGFTKSQFIKAASEDDGEWVKKTTGFDFLQKGTRNNPAYIKNQEEFDLARPWDWIFITINKGTVGQRVMLAQKFSYIALDREKVEKITNLKITEDGSEGNPFIMMDATKEKTDRVLKADEDTCLFIPTEDDNHRLVRKKQCNLKIEDTEEGAVFVRVDVHDTIKKGCEKPGFLPWKITGSPSYQILFDEFKKKPSPFVVPKPARKKRQLALRTDQPTQPPHKKRHIAKTTIDCQPSSADPEPMDADSVMQPVVDEMSTCLSLLALSKELRK